MERQAPAKIAYLAAGGTVDGWESVKGMVAEQARMRAAVDAAGTPAPSLLPAGSC